LEINILIEILAAVTSLYPLIFTAHTLLANSFERKSILKRYEIPEMSAIVSGLTKKHILPITVSSKKPTAS
jgi:hypothetical protein